MYPLAGSPGSRGALVPREEVKKGQNKGLFGPSDQKGLYFALCLAVFSPFWSQNSIFGP